MNGMDAVIQIRARAVKGFSIYADKSRGCAERLPLRASPDAFHSTPKIRKREVDKQVALETLRTLLHLKPQELLNV